MPLPACVQQVQATMTDTDWHKSYLAFRSEQQNRDKDIRDVYTAYERLRKKEFHGQNVVPPDGSETAIRLEKSLRQKSKQIESQQALLQDLQGQLSAQEIQVRELASRLNASMAQAGSLLVQLENTQKLLEKREIELVNLRSDLTAIENPPTEEAVVTREEVRFEPVTSSAARLAERIPRRMHACKRFEKPPQFIAVGSDGKCLTSTSNVLHVMSLGTEGFECSDIPVPGGASELVCGSFSNNNETVFVGTSEGGLHLVASAHTDTPRKAALKGHTGKIKNCRFLENDVSKGISAAADRTIKFWDMNRLCPIGSIPVASQIVNAVVCPDAAIVVSSHVNGDISLWSANQKIHQFRAHTDACLGVNVSPDGKYLVSIGKDDAVKLFDVKMIQAGPVLNLGGFTALSTEGPPGISWDSTVISACIGGGVRFWELGSGKQLSGVSTHALLHAWCPRMNSRIANSDAHIVTVHADHNIKWYTQ